MSNPIIIASLRTLEASRLTLFKAEHFGTVRHLCDEDGTVFKCATYKGKTYLIDSVPDVIGSPLDFVVGMVRNILAVIGVMALVLHIGLHYGGFYGYLASVYPHSAVIRFIAGS